MSLNPTPAQLAAALQAYDEVLGMNPTPNYKEKASAMRAALRAAADVLPRGSNEKLQRVAAG